MNAKRSISLLVLSVGLLLAPAHPLSAEAMTSPSSKSECVKKRRTAKKAYDKVAKSCDRLSKRRSALHKKIFADIAKWEAEEKSLLSRISSEKVEKRKGALMAQYDKRKSRAEAKNKKDMTVWDALVVSTDKTCGPDLDAAQQAFESFGTCQ